MTTPAPCPMCPTCGHGDGLAFRRILDDDGIKALVVWCARCDAVVDDDVPIEWLEPTAEDLLWLAAPDSGLVS